MTDIDNKCRKCEILPLEYQAENLMKSIFYNRTKVIPFQLLIGELIDLDVAMNSSFKEFISDSSCVLQVIEVPRSTKIS